MRRISFDENEEQRMSNVLQRAFGKAMSPSVPKESVPELPLAPDVSGVLESNGNKEEYEKLVILESVRRAKERSGLIEKGVSVAEDREKTGGAPKNANGALTEPEFVYLPFGVFRERIGVAEKIIFFYLCAISEEYGVATVSLRQIVDGTCIGKTCVCQALSELRNAGWIRWDMVRTGRSRLNRYFILRWKPSTVYCSKSGHCSETEHGSENGQRSQSGHSSECEQRSDSEQSGKSLATTGFVRGSSEYGQCPENEQGSDCGHSSVNGQCPQSGHSSECEQYSDNEQSGKSLVATEFIGCSSATGQCSENRYGSDSGQCTNFEPRRKIVDTTEFRRDLTEILRTVKTVDLKDLKDINILKDLKDKNKISDFVNNLCVTRVDNSMVAEYVSTMFRIAFPGQSTERLQVVRKLTKRLQVGFAWYVVLLFIIKSSPYLMGKDKNSEGWKCTLTWALAADNYPKIMQLTYVKYGLRWTPQNFIEYLCRSLEKGEY